MLPWEAAQAKGVMPTDYGRKYQFNSGMITGNQNICQTVGTINSQVGRKPHIPHNERTAIRITATHLPKGEKYEK